MRNGIPDSIVAAWNAVDRQLAVVWEYKDAFGVQMCPMFFVLLSYVVSLRFRLPLPLALSALGRWPVPSPPWIFVTSLRSVDGCIGSLLDALTLI